MKKDEKIIKQAVGIDCSKDTLDVCFSQQTNEWQIIHKATTNFQNNKKGFNQLLRWVHKLSVKEVPINFVIEATGVYHEQVTHYLFDAGKRISVVLPNRARHFAQTLKVKTVNDKESSKMLATLGLEKQLDAWQKPDPVFALLKKLTREYEQLKANITKCKNEIHAEKHSAFPCKSSIQRLQKTIDMLKKQCQEIKKEIIENVSHHPNIAEKINRVCTIPGVGFMTAVTIIGETNGFNLFRNSKQLVSYAGYDVVKKESGISVRGKAHLSKKGNRHIRRALHFPALTSVKHDSNMRNFYNRLFDRQKVKMKSYVAVQRKLLVLIYTLWKKDEEYNPNYREEVKNKMNKEGVKKEVKGEVVMKEINTSNKPQPIKINTSDVDKKSVLLNEQGRTIISIASITDDLVAKHIEESSHKIFWEREREFPLPPKRTTDAGKKRIKKIGQ